MQECVPSGDSKCGSRSEASQHFDQQHAGRHIFDESIRRITMSLIWNNKELKFIKRGEKFDRLEYAIARKSHVQYKPNKVNSASANLKVN